MKLEKGKKDEKNAKVDDAQVEDNVEDVPTQVRFDDDGNLIEGESEFDFTDGFEDEEDEVEEQPDTDYEDAQPEDEEDEEQESDEPEEEPELADDAEDEAEDEKPEKGKRKLSPAEIKVINLKKENQALQKKAQELEQEFAASKKKDEQDSLKQKYIDDGYDEDTAKNMTDAELRMKSLEEKTELFEFKENNEDVFGKYPEAKKDVTKIMRNSKLTGMTAEQICRAMYGDSDITESERKAVSAAKGESTRTPNTDNVYKAKQSATSNNDGQRLSAADIRFKQKLEKLFNDGKPLTVKEFRKYSNE